MLPPLDFFISEKFNLAVFIIRDHEADRIAIYLVREDRPGIENLTWPFLRKHKMEEYDAMVSRGVRAGDKVRF